MELKEVVKPPFANYDVVVYFGCGLFCLPLAFHYIIEPSGLRFPRFQFHIGIAFADTAISTLSLLFAVYVLGHILAYVSSFSIEKTVDLFFGRISSAIIMSNLLPYQDQSEAIQGWIARRFKRSMTGRQRWWTISRMILLLPVTPSLLVPFSFQWFDYFKTRVSQRVFSQVKRRCYRRGYGPVGLHTSWYKAVEHDVINNNPNATARMYNYLVISGVFRSLGFIFLSCAWAELIYWIIAIVRGIDYIKPVMSDSPLRFAHLVSLTIYNILFSFAVAAYIKFSRRYVEEALFAFVMARDQSKSSE